MSRRPGSPPSPHLVPAPPPWVEERPLALEVEPGPRRACRKCGADQERMQAQADAANLVLRELLELLDGLAAELRETHLARELAECEARDLRLLLGEYDDQVRGYLRTLLRARKALARVSEERRLALARIARLERYIQALEGRARDVVESENDASRITPRELARASGPAPRGGGR